MSPKESSSAWIPWWPRLVRITGSRRCGFDASRVARSERSNWLLLLLLLASAASQSLSPCSAGPALSTLVSTRDGAQRAAREHAHGIDARAVSETHVARPRRAAGRHHHPRRVVTPPAWGPVAGE